MTIYRYTIPRVGKYGSRFQMQIHGDGEVLSVHEEKSREEGYVQSMHVLVDTTAPVELRTFRIYGKGDKMDDMKNEVWTHVGSWKSVTGYAYHLFEIFE